MHVDNVQLGIAGAGGLAEEMIAMILSNSLADSIQLTKSQITIVDASSKFSELMGIKVVSESEYFQIQREDCSFHVAISDPRTRERVSNKFLSKGVKPFSLISSEARIDPYAKIGEGVYIANGVSITGSAQVGNFAQLNIGSLLAHGSTLGDYSVLSPNSLCLGNVLIDSHTFVGAGAIIREGKRGDPRLIGSDVTIGMGSIVLRNVPAGSTFVGNPAFNIRKNESVKVNTDEI